MNTTTSAKRGWRESGIYLALLAAFFTAITLLIDTYVLKNVILHEHKQVAILVYLTLGSWVGVVFTLVYNRLFATKIDPTFSGERLLQGSSGRYVAFAGVASVLATFFYFFVAGKGDPSVVIALNTVTVIWLALYDGHKNSARNMWRGLLAAFMVMAGAVLVAYGDPNAKTGVPLTFWDIILVVVFSCGAYAFSKIYMAKLSVAKENMVNASFWRFFWFAIAASFASPLYAWFNSWHQEYFDLLRTTAARWEVWATLVILMAMAYGSNTLESLAFKYENASTITIIKSAQTVVAIPIGLLVLWFLPDLFAFPSEPYVWLVRFVGSLIIVCAIWLVPKKEKPI